MVILLKRLLLMTMALAGLAACSDKELREAYEIVNEGVKELPLTRQEVTAALKESLSLGISKSARIASARNGFLGNPQIRIEFPPDVKKVEDAIRGLGFDAQVDRFITQLNRGAEKAAARAKPIFIDAITSMTIEDAFGILNGKKNAATQYLKRSTGDSLRAAFRPIVSDKLDETGATRYYGDIVERYNRIPLVKDVDPDLVGYATEQAINGLFKLVAEEEARIRADPVARTSELLRRVFGSLD